MVALWFLLALVLLAAALYLLKLDREQRRPESLDSARRPADGSADGPVAGTAAGVDSSAPAPVPTRGPTADPVSSGSAPSGPAPSAPESVMSGGAPRFLEADRSAPSVQRAESAPAAASTPAAPTASGVSDRLEADGLTAPRPAPFQGGAPVPPAAPAGAPVSATGPASGPTTSSSSTPPTTPVESERVSRSEPEPEPEARPRTETGSIFVDHSADADADAADAEASDRSASSGRPAGAAVAGAAAAGGAALGGVAARVRGVLSRRRSERAGEAGQDAVEGDGSTRPDADAAALADSPALRWLERRDFHPSAATPPHLSSGDFAGRAGGPAAVSEGLFRGGRVVMGVADELTVFAVERPAVTRADADLRRSDVPTVAGWPRAASVDPLELHLSDPAAGDLLRDGRIHRAAGSAPAGLRRVWTEDRWVVATVDGRDAIEHWDDTVVTLHEAAAAFAVLPAAEAEPVPADTDPGAPGAKAGPVVAGGSSAIRRGSGSGAGAASGYDTPATAQTAAIPTVRDAGPARLHSVPDRPAGFRDLSDTPVVADRGDTAATEPAEAASTPVDQAAEQPADEPDRFASVMNPPATLPSRGDVAADHLEQRPPSPRPSRTSSSFESAEVPAIGEPAQAGGAHLKSIGGQDDAAQIDADVERFEAARVTPAEPVEPAQPAAEPELTEPTESETTPATSPVEREASGGRRGRHYAAEGERPEWMKLLDENPRPSTGRHRRAADPDPGSTPTDPKE